MNHPFVTKSFLDSPIYHSGLAMEMVLEFGFKIWDPEVKHATSHLLDSANNTWHPGVFLTCRHRLPPFRLRNVRNSSRIPLPVGSDI